MTETNLLSERGPITNYSSFGDKFIRVFSSEERHRALREPGVGQAAHLIRDAVIGHQDAPYEGYYDPYKNEEHAMRNTISVVCGRLVVQLKGLVDFACWILFLLTFFEPPPWCRDASDLQIDSTYNDGSGSNGYGDCEVILNAYGTTADNVENQQYYPNSSAMFLTISQSMHIELGCVFFVSTYMLLKFADDGFIPSLFLYPGIKRWVHSTQITLLACILMGYLAGNTVLNPFLRMILLATFHRTSQRELLTFIEMVPNMLFILIVLAIIIVFYAWFGVVIFYDSAQGQNGFQNLFEGIWTLWICVTTANYPDVMMPSFNENRLSALYFVSFMGISFFYLMNLVLAFTCNKYDESIAERTKSRQELSQKLLNEAFDLLLHDGKQKVSRDSIMHVMTILNRDIPEIQRLSHDERSIIFAFLDSDGSGSINREEFLRFGKVLLLDLAKESDYATFVETRLPFINRTRWYQRLCQGVKSKTFEYAIDVILVLNAVIIAGQDLPLLAGYDVTIDPNYSNGSLDTVWEKMEAFFTAVYVIEAMLKILVNGWKRYSENPRNLFDFIITVLAVSATAYVYYPNAYSNSLLIRFVVMARVFRLLRLLFAIEAFHMIGLVTVDILPASTSVFMMLLYVGYFFAYLGMLLYGGLITRDPSNPLSQTLLEAEDFVSNDYWANNFNDMPSAINVLFNLLVVNNWTECEIGFEQVTGRKWPVRLFFFSFHVLGVIGLSNVVTSFIINAFFQQLETLNQRKGWEESVEGEAVLRGSQAVFDSSRVTGTETGIHSTYIARVKPRHSDVEMDERQALRDLFTRKSSSAQMD